MAHVGIPAKKVFQRRNPTTTYSRSKDVAHIRSHVHINLVVDVYLNYKLPSVIFCRCFSYVIFEVIIALLC